MTMDLTKYQAPKHVTLTLPGKLGSVLVQPITSKAIKVWSPQLLIGAAIYTFDSHMQRVDDRWYFVNKAEIGVTGGRPTPKLSYTTLDIIAGTVNEALLGEEVFQQQLQSIRDAEEQRAKDLERTHQIAQLRVLRKNVRNTTVRILETRERLQQLDDDLVIWQQQLAEYEEEHQDIVALTERDYYG